MIRIRQKGNFSKTKKYFKQLKDTPKKVNLDEYGRLGVAALSSATPVNSGKTAESWYYEIIYKDTSASINFCNSNIQNGVSIAIILQYGHGTNNGGYVEGIDYINPALTPVFKKMANDAWKEVVSL